MENYSNEEEKRMCPFGDYLERLNRALSEIDRKTKSFQQIESIETSAEKLSEQGSEFGIELNRIVEFAEHINSMLHF